MRQHSLNGMDQLQASPPSFSTANGSASYGFSPGLEPKKSPSGHQICGLSAPSKVATRDAGRPRLGCGVFRVGKIDLDNLDHAGAFFPREEIWVLPTATCSGSSAISASPRRISLDRASILGWYSRGFSSGPRESSHCCFFRSFPRTVSSGPGFVPTSSPASRTVSSSDRRRRLSPAQSRRTCRTMNVSTSVPFGYVR